MKRSEQKQNTRQKLIEATIDSLNEVGYSQTSTTGIVKRAGLSQGILFHHFPTKKDLIVAVCAYVNEKNIGLGSSIIKTEKSELVENEEISALLDFMWKNSYQGRYANVISELRTVAQTDYELAVALNPIFEKSGKAVMRKWEEILYSKREEIPLNVIKDMVHTFLSGMVSYFISEADLEYQNQVMETWKSLVIPLIGIRDHKN